MKRRETFHFSSTWKVEEMSMGGRLLGRPLLICAGAVKPILGDCPNRLGHRIIQRAKRP